MIGNHTYHHLNGWDQSMEDYLRDIESCNRVIEENGFSSRIKLFRPPYGKIKKMAIDKIKDDYHIIMWDVLSYDFSSRLSEERMLGKSVQNTLGGSIIVFHDSERTKSRVEFIIVKYIEHFLTNNYEFSTIDELILSN